MYSQVPMYAPRRGLGLRKVHQNQRGVRRDRAGRPTVPSDLFKQRPVAQSRSTGFDPRCIRRYIMAKRTSLKLTGDRQRLLDQATEIVAADETDDPPMSVVIDAALTHLVQSRQNIDDARGEIEPTTIQQFNTDVLGLRYRTSVESRWR